MSLGDELGFRKQGPGFATKAIHTGQNPEQWNSRAVVPPISLATTYKQFGPGQHAGFEYSRSGNPTRNVLEECLAALDNGRHALTFASGLGTQTAIISTLKTGEGIITNDDNYSGTNGLFKNLAVNLGIEVTFVDTTKLKAIETAIKPNLKLVWLETPTNPMMKLIDIKAVADLVHIKSDAVVVVDNTALSPYFLQPLDLGADVVTYSLSKYMGGHSDVIMGSIALNSDELYEKLKFHQNATGIVPSPFNCYLVNRGLKTLALRMERHFKNSVAVAKFLENHPKVEKVLHPALPSHPQHSLAKAQTFGHSGVFSFYIKDATSMKTSRFLRQLTFFSVAVSFGGCESLAENPSEMMKQFGITAEERRLFGFTEGLVRLSVGLEDAQELIHDLQQAFECI